MNLFDRLAPDFARIIGKDRPAAPMTDDERADDALLSLENRRRYMQQSAATLDGSPAPLPPRARPGASLPIGAGAGSSYDIEETLDAQDRETDPEFAFCYGDRNG